MDFLKFGMIACLCVPSGVIMYPFAAGRYSERAR